MADLEGGNADETTPLEIDNDDSEVVAKAVTPKELCTRIALSFKDPIFLVILGFYFY